MRAAIYDRPGPAREVLRLDDVEPPEPARGEVRVRVAVSGVNPTDIAARSSTTPDGFQIPHQDGAGEIDAVGEDVDTDRIGQRVWVWFAAQSRWGTAAEWTVVAEHQAVPLPETVSYDLGASLGIPAMTAYHCLFADGGLRGTTALVAGGAGAVGHFAIELARWGGAQVVATVGTDEKAELATQAGADLVVYYTAKDAGEQIASFASPIDRVVEVALTANLGLDLSLAAAGTVIVSYAASSQDPTLPVRSCMEANVLLRFVLIYGVDLEKLTTAAREVTVALGTGALSSLPVHRYGLEQIVEAHEAVESGVTGKVVLELSERAGQLPR